MTTNEIISELERRDVHVRQFMGRSHYELWADGVFKSSSASPINMELAVRKLLGITNEQGIAVEKELVRRLAVS